MHLRRQDIQRFLAAIADATALPPSSAALLAGMVVFAPADLCSPLLFAKLQRQALIDDCTDLPERCFELVLAWGCGRRGQALASGVAHEPWPTAALALALLSEPQVGHVLRQLRELQLPSPLHERIDALCANHIAGEQGYGQSLALEIVAKNGLHAWQPTRCSLRQHLLVLFGGTAGAGALRSAAFAHGLLYPLLREAIGMHVGTVAFLVCNGPMCHATRIVTAVTKGHPIKVSELDGVGLFEGSHCACCGQHAQPKQTYRLFRRHWLFAPQAHGGAYEQWLFHKCTACGHHFPCSASYISLYQAIEAFQSVNATADRSSAHQQMLAQASRSLSALRTQTVCPLCQRSATSQRPVHLWIYAPTASLTKQMMVE
jgi:hypothetical protein